LSSPPAGLRVRDAAPGDLDVIVDFNARLASETEDKTLDRVALTRGVRAALADPDRLRYWVAVSAGSGRVVGQAAVTREWSDWRDGWFWWFQSVYVRPEARHRGAFRSLHAHIRAAALSAGGVVGLRLYVDDANDHAHRTYEALGLTSGGYRVYEEVWKDRLPGGREPV